MHTLECLGGLWPWVRVVDNTHACSPVSLTCVCVCVGVLGCVVCVLCVCCACVVGVLGCVVCVLCVCCVCVVCVLWVCCGCVSVSTCGVCVHLCPHVNMMRVCVPAYVPACQCVGCLNSSLSSYK